MKKIGIISFSTASKSRKTEAFTDLHIITLKTFINEQMYVRGNITLGEFFGQVMATGVAPKTSQPSTGEIVEVYNEMLTKYKDIIIIAPRKELSGTYQNSVLAVSMLDEKLAKRINVIEVNCVGMVETLCTERAISLIHKDINIKDIVKEITSFSKTMTTFAFPGSLKFLKLSGRVSGSSAFIGEILNMKTAVKVTNEYVKVDHKGRGEKSCLKYINNQIKELKPTHACISDIKADKNFLEEMVALIEKHAIDVYFTEEADIVTGTHFGPSSFGVTFYK
ncbi:MAG: DegV family protein [Mycoplasmatales bacterium]